MSRWRVVRGIALEAVPWRNGLGTSWTIAGETAEGALVWQVGIAELVRDAAFSDYRGIERVFTPLSGDVALAFHGGAFEACPVLVPKRFGGEWPTLSRVGQAGRAFNALADRGAYRVAVEVVRFGVGAVEVAGGEVTVVHCLEGKLRLEGVELSAGDSVVGSGAASLEASEGGILLAAVFEAA